MSNGVFWLLAGGIGLLGGVGEILRRYHRSILRTLISPAALILLILYVGIAILAFALTQAFGWAPPGLTGAVSVALIQALASGFGGLLLLRTTLTFQTPNPTVVITLSEFFENLLKAIVRAMGQRETNESLQAVCKMMKGISFEKAHLTLPFFVFISIP